MLQNWHDEATQLDGDHKRLVRPEMIFFDNRINDAHGKLMQLQKYGFRQNALSIQFDGLHSFALFLPSFERKYSNNIPERFDTSMLPTTLLVRP